jgi:sec-independent protein translocase protein TatB
MGVALIVVGPSKLPELAKSLAKGLSAFRKATDEVKSTLTEHESFKDLESTVQSTVDSIKPASRLNLEPACVKPTPEVIPVVEVKRFEASAVETAKTEPAPGDTLTEAAVAGPALEPKKPVENLTGRMAALDSIVAEHQGAEVSAAQEKSAETAAPPTKPKANV